MIPFDGANRMIVDGKAPEVRERRMLKACEPCRLRRTKCEDTRPCSSCVFRGLDCSEEVKAPEESCSLCKRKKLYCDKERPCGRCKRQGVAAECMPASLAAAQQSRVRRQPDTPGTDNGSPVTDSASPPNNNEGTGAMVVSSNKRPRTMVPNAATFFDFENLPGSQTSSSSSPSMLWHGFSENGQMTGQSVRDRVPWPESPIPFPDDPTSSTCAVVSRKGKQPWPKSLLFMFKLYRCADHLCERVMAHTTPKLYSSILRVCQAVDVLSSHFPTSSNMPEVPKIWDARKRLWKDSQRCGSQTYRCDRTFGVLSGLDVNQVWADLAGLHREEFISRAFAGENLMPTSELRQTCKLFFIFRQMLLAMLKTKATGVRQDISGSNCMRLSRNWGRGDRGPGVLVRMSVSSTMGEGQDWLHLQHTIVEVTPEEYEAARAIDPLSCEGYMIPVVGSKSAAELLAPDLAEKESFAFLSSHPAGRAALDRFADFIEKEYQFVFETLASLETGSLGPDLPPLYRPDTARRGGAQSSGSPEPRGTPRPASGSDAPGHSTT